MLNDPLCNRLRTMFRNERIPPVDPARSFALSACHEALVCRPGSAVVPNEKNPDSVRM